MLRRRLESVRVDPQEFLCDGGDHPPKAHLLKNDTVAGLQPEDTVVHYTTEAGDILFQPSNRACLYSPRFASVRKITAAVAGEKAIGLANVDRPTQINRIGMNQGGLVVREFERSRACRGCQTNRRVS